MVNLCSYRHAVTVAACVLAPLLLMQPVPAADQSNASVLLYQLGEGKESEYGFRIPALAVSKSGTLLAFAERRVGLHDHSENDIVLRRSSDKGTTWSEIQVVAEAGGDSLNDPCVVVLDSGRILLRYTHFPKGVHARTTRHTVIADPGYDGPKNVRLFLTHSDDDGLTWSAPRDVTRAMRRESAISVGSPGSGVVLSTGKHRGRVLLPSYEVYHLGDGKRKSKNSVSYSDDGGKSWTLSQTIAEPGPVGTGDEAQLVELTGGRVLLSARDRDGGDYRKISISSDGGQSWSRHRQAKDLVTPACMSSVIRYSWPDDGRPGILLHSLPNKMKSRSNGTIMISRDEGDSWKPACVIVPGSFEYSCLVRLPEGDVGCLFETDRCREMCFLRVPAASVIGR